MASDFAVPATLNNFFRADHDMSVFQIHPELLADCHHLGRFNLCHVLLHCNAALPWFILVPQCDVCDLLELPIALRNAAMKEAAIVSEFIKRQFAYPKVNFAAIGNVVPQLHLHIVGRKPDDPCWPAPVWGNLRETREYSSAELRQITDSLVHAGLTVTDQ
jgi:diadenosine tetraphosphate (Ap4A) HIT family hydrolase